MEGWGLNRLLNVVAAKRQTGASLLVTLLALLVTGVVALAAWLAWWAHAPLALRLAGWMSSGPCTNASSVCSCMSSSRSQPSAQLPRAVARCRRRPARGEAGGCTPAGWTAILNASERPSDCASRFPPSRAAARGL